jgi:two-component system KDP operon response regulator KdpE
MISRILVVDDERQIRRVLKEELAQEGYIALTAETGERAVRMMDLAPPDLIVLDLGLPGMSGFDVCRAVRTRSSAPILVLSLRCSERDKVEALNLGADDYVTKPFGMEELLARVRALLRRGNPDQPPARLIEAGDLRINGDQRHVTLRGAQIHLTRIEYDILCFLARNTGRVVTHEMILQAVWRTAYEEDVQTLRFHVAQLRKKIELDVTRPRYIITEIGIGYRFVMPTC